MNLLYPQENNFRRLLDLNGLWDFDIDPDDQGEGRGWGKTPDLHRTIAVPGSWNEQFTDLHDYMKAAWYRRTFFARKSDFAGRVFLRLGAACHHCRVWLNGTFLGEYRLGYLPAVFDATAALRDGVNHLVVKVDSVLTGQTLPTTGRDRGHWAGIEIAADYFPYSGLHRDVCLVGVGEDSLVNAKVETTLQGQGARARVRLWLRGQVDAVRLRLLDDGREVAAAEVCVSEQIGEGVLEVAEARLWSPQSPHLYTLRIESLVRGGIVDQYDLPVGLRTIRVNEKQVLLNGQPITLRGFSRHEDFPIVGRGHLDAVMVRDFELLKWIGANTFRTSHYPYDEKQYQLADRLGVLVTGEAPAVSLFCGKHGQDRDSLVNAEVLGLHQQALRDMVARDWNHPSVIAWSVANECNGTTPKALEYFRTITSLARELDPSRLIVHTNWGENFDKSHQFCDVICLNHYDFACKHPGRNMAEVKEALSRRLDAAYEEFKRPIFLSEFGICGIPGMHSLAPLYFTEEGQVDHVFTYLDVAATKDFLVGVQIWLLQDFKAQECNGRPTQNFKGMFDRLRQPKLIAHLLRQRWASQRL
jgi:beta-glucuronidase